MTVVFPKSEKRAQWEKMFYEMKQRLAAALDRHPIPEFIASIPIRKTRAGLQFTCAASTIGVQKDVWVCNSDGYVGQVCVLSLVPEPTVTSCNGVCNARILCIATVPAYSSPKLTESTVSIASSGSGKTSLSTSRRSTNTGGGNLEKKTSNVSSNVSSNLKSCTIRIFKSLAENDSILQGSNSSSGERDIQLDSSSSSDDSEELEPPTNQPLRRLNSAKASSTPQLSSSAPNSTGEQKGLKNVLFFAQHHSDQHLNSKCYWALVSLKGSVFLLNFRHFHTIWKGNVKLKNSINSTQIMWCNYR